MLCIPEHLALQLNLQFNLQQESAREARVAFAAVCCSAGVAMAVEVSESGSRAFLRFGLSGVVFTILGPSLFWLAYPLGPFLAVALTELLVHALRYATFRLVVFPTHRGYRVNLPRYILSALPVSLAVVWTVALFRNRLDRTTLTLTGALISVAVGFVWSRYLYSRPAGRSAKEARSTRTSSSSGRGL